MKLGFRRRVKAGSDGLVIDWRLGWILLLIITIRGVTIMINAPKNEVAAPTPQTPQIISERAKKTSGLQPPQKA